MSKVVKPDDCIYVCRVARYNTIQLKQFLCLRLTFEYQLCVGCRSKILQPVSEEDLSNSNDAPKLTGQKLHHLFNSFIIT